MTNRLACLLLVLTAAFGAVACGGAVGQTATSSSSTTGSSSSSTNQYAAAYQAAKWGSTVSVGYPSSCEMMLTTTGQPDYTPNPWYLAPAGGNATIVAYSAQTHTGMSLISFASMKSSLQGATTTLNTCPSAASSTTSAGLGAIGYLISGTALFNPYEMDGSTAAVNDNASYTFTDTNGNVQTAYFLDQCDSHSNGTTWHAHGNPNCVASQVDTATGPSHILGIALDGFPIYGGRDVNGNLVTASQLDACNGITSATPEFPSGAYHYVLPVGETSSKVSINCYRGTVSQTTLARARALYCNMRQMMAMTANAEMPGMAMGREADR